MLEGTDSGMKMKPTPGKTTKGDEEEGQEIIERIFKIN